MVDLLWFYFFAEWKIYWTRVNQVVFVLDDLKLGEPTSNVWTGEWINREKCGFKKKLDETI